ncbi:ANTAR domain-containing protein [Actinomycetospora aeridis]|uniref:ANTAR domain-containing protein n=1 Tax=Actinomycetospora aeridis TaxID=3129231 RepID=A0ABU8NEU1_9PSEU
MDEWNGRASPDAPGSAQDSRDAISCATGILMERYGCDLTTATERLVAWSRDTDIEIALIAAWLIADLTATWNGEQA